MRFLLNAVGAVALLAGLGLLGYAVYLPTRFPMTEASAIQVSQVYTQATYYTGLAIACLVLSGVLILALQGDKE